MDRNEYIEIVISKLKDRKNRLEIKQEIENHIADRKEYYLDCGFSQEEAEQKALEHMGDAKELSVTISNLHNSDIYKKLSLIFSGLYCFGIILGLILTQMFLSRVILLDDGFNAGGACIASVVVFLFASLSFRFAHKSQDELSLYVNGCLGIANVLLAPLTFLPCGYSILALIFEFPVSLYTSNEVYGGTFTYFYFPFENIIFEQMDFSGVYSEIMYVILWFLMCFFGLFPIISAVLSLVTASHIKHEQYENINEAFLKKIKKYSKMLLVLSVAGVIAITIEASVTEISAKVQRERDEANHIVYIEEALEIFEGIPIPCSEEQALKLVSNDVYNEESDYKEFGSLTVMANNGCSIFLYEDSSYNEYGEYDGVFDEKRIIISGEGFSLTQVKEAEKTPVGTDIEEFFKTYPKENCEEISVTNCNEGELIYVTLSCYDSNDDYSYVCVSFLNGKFDSVLW